ncbi:rhodopsin-like [Centropristis striata]|uniref:rhodopsin-like n=1 Tax=Centropristis striata TaxID=184440 RepID=UPI0027DFE3ED|nr:rhodopsin-like [Centropristis striata]
MDMDISTVVSGSPYVDKLHQHHPMAEQPKTEWESALCDCFEDTSSCCYGFWCCPCLACTVSERFGENRCLPFCDICCPFITASTWGVPLTVPPAVLSLRVAMRNRYGIKGSVCNDILASCFCGWCAWCQMHRELKHRKKTPSVITVQSQTVVQMQPAPEMMAPGYPPQSGMMVPGYPPQSGMMAPGYPPQSGMMAPGYPPQSGMMAPGYPPQSGMMPPGYTPQSGMMAPGYPPQSGMMDPGYPPQSVMMDPGNPPQSGFKGESEAPLMSH